jgi:hypothetical protein
MFSKRKFTILVGEDDTHTGCKQEHTFIFHLVDEKACKHLWKCAVEYHAFFRLRTSPRQLLASSSGGSGGSMNGSSGGGNGGGLLNGFIRRGSRFRGPERTEFQTLNMQRNSAPRRSVQFERKPSQRFSRRASYANKRRQNQQQQQQGQDQGRQQSCSNQAILMPPPPSQHHQNHAQHQAQHQNLKLKTGYQNQQNAAAAPVATSRTNNSKMVMTAMAYSVESATTSSGQHFSVKTTAVTTVQKCCRLQASSNGAEHDLKCNLYKAQMMQQQQQMSFAQKSSLNNSRMVSNVNNGGGGSCGGSSNSCASSSSSSGVVMPSSSSSSSSGSTNSSCEKNVCCDTDSADEINVDTRPTAATNLRGNLLDAENGLLCNEKLTNKDTKCLLASKSNTKKPSQANNINSTSNGNSTPLNNNFVSNQNRANTTYANTLVNLNGPVANSAQRVPPQLHPRVEQRMNGNLGDSSTRNNGKQTHIITEI